MDGGEKSDKDWIIITEALPENYVLVKLEDPTCRERTDNKDGEEEEEKKEEEKKMYMTYFSSNRKGVAILINKPHTILNASCEGGEYAWVHVEMDSQKYTFVSVYYDADGPNLIGHLMLKIFYSFLADGPDAFTCTPVIGGDFNTTLDPELDANKEISRHAPLRKTLNDFMSILKLSDVWRKKHDEARIYTYIQNKEPKKPTKFVQSYTISLKMACVKISETLRDILNVYDLQEALGEPDITDSVIVVNESTSPSSTAVVIEDDLQF
ncbi:hypothetical protein DPX16_3447 [Anabarilius grahami]|uniref:Endonuclease/exonuclease/phosphatase domain-containing protein n=1 Tax=Anabarilius grahami TaxID=495550 RepID=A0A3N0XKN1_ANAGA|nr:hypothetical protein DPX16_3447 [Anabarilius grahami]